jgi:C-terminal processing protease CtpA/Prc
MRTGAELVAFNDQPIGEAIVEIMPFAAPYSTRAELRYQQLRYLLRTKVGGEAQITFRNPAEAEQTVILKAIDERESLDATSIYAGLDSWGLPVEYWYLDDQIGNILVATNADDAELTLSLFERALDAFEADDVDRIVLDFRQNDGGALLGLAGFFTGDEIAMAQELQRDTVTGEFETRGAPLVIRPKGRIFEFKQIAVLVGYGCASACEAEVYALSTLANVEIVGQYPTSGMFSAVISEEYIMPELFTFQFSKWRYQTADGRLFLEGQGVAPTIQVPISEATVLDQSDVVRQAALEALRER